jgi:hypothetical protein
VSELPIIASDRSRCADSEKCMRLRYWRYEHNGRGLERPGEWLDPLMGTAVHDGIESYLTGSIVQGAVAHSLETMHAARRSGPIHVFRANTDFEADWSEALGMVELLVRGWIAARGAQLLKDYEVIATEREFHVDFPVGGRTVRFLVRPDILPRRRSDGGLFIMNLKTASRVDQKWREKWRYDMSTFTEMLAVESELGEHVSGVIMAGLVKGSRKDYPMGSGNYHWESPLLWPWKREGGSINADEWYPRYEWHCVGPHKMGNGRPCPGDKDHRLSGVHKANVAKEYPGGPAAWIAFLVENDLEFLENQFVELTPIMRSPYEMETWKRQVLPRELEIRERRDYLMSSPAGVAGDPVHDDLLDKWFPMSTSDGNCIWPSPCQFKDVCWGNLDIDDPESGFVARDPNHPTEFVVEE